MKKMILGLILLSIMLVSAVGVSAIGACCICKSNSNPPNFNRYVVYSQAVDGCRASCRAESNRPALPEGVGIEDIIEHITTQQQGLVGVCAVNNAECLVYMNAQGEAAADTEICLAAGVPNPGKCCGKLVWSAPNPSVGCVDTSWFGGTFGSSWHRCNSAPGSKYQCSASDVVYTGSTCVNLQPACFLPGTKITMGDLSDKNIEDVNVGETVLSYDQKNAKNVVSEVVRQFVHDFSGMYLVINGNLQVTPEHLMLVNGKWGQAAFVQVGDYLIDVKGEKVVIQSIEKKQAVEPIHVYNLEVAGTHTFYAQGLVHNEDKVSTGACCRVGGVHLASVTYQQCYDTEYNPIEPISWNENQGVEFCGNGGGAPEFSTTGIILSILVVLGVVLFFVRKKNK